MCVDVFQYNKINFSYNFIMSILYCHIDINLKIDLVLVNYPLLAILSYWSRSIFTYK